MGREDNIKWGENKNELGTQATAGAQEDRLKHIHLVQEAEQKKMDLGEGGVVADLGTALYQWVSQQVRQ